MPLTAAALAVALAVVVAAVGVLAAALVLGLAVLAPAAVQRAVRGLRQSAPTLEDRLRHCRRRRR